MLLFIEKTVGTFLFLLLFSPPLVAQPTTAVYEVGANIGAFIYQGDLTPADAGSFKTPSVVVGVNAAKWINSNLGLRLDLNIGRLRGNEAAYAHPEWRQQRAFAFKARAVEIAASALYAPLGTERKVSPYLFGGIGYSFLRITRDYSRFNAEYFGSQSLNDGLAADLQENPPKGIPIMPVGAGARYGLTDHLTVTAEGSYRIMSTDYLDGFSKAANPERKDHYYKYSVGLLYSIGKKSRYACPVIKY